jgi:hypothetical protein
MRKLKYKRFAGWSVEESLCDFINENNIKQSDILKIVHNSESDLKLFYYVVE